MSNVTGLDINGITFILHLTGRPLTSAFVFIISQDIVISNSVFQNGSSQSPGRTILSADTNIIITNCLFEGNTGNSYGGAILALHGTIITLTGNTFTRNQVAEGSGGAIYVEESAISLGGSAVFSNNKAEKGGAFGISGGSLYVTGSVNFYNNKAIKGGAIFIRNSRAEFGKGIFMFEENVAEHLGGGMYISTSSFIASSDNFTFVGNTAEGSEHDEVCGVLCVYVTLPLENSVVNMSATFSSNSGTAGGALFIEKAGNCTIYNICARNNLGGAFGVLYATVNFVGTNLFCSNNNLKLGGAVTVTNSSVTFNGSSTFNHNNADKGAISLTNNSKAIFLGNSSILNNIGRSGGGGINSVDSAVIFSGNTSFLNNIGMSGGGGATRDSTISLYSDTLFINNSGPKGGAVFTERGTLQLSLQTNITNNTAKTYGGGIFASDTIIKMQDVIVYIATVTFSSNSARRGVEVQCI